MCIESNPTPGDNTIIGSSPNMHLELDMNFDDMAFAHMLKDYLVVPRLSYAIRNWFVSMLLFNRVHRNVNIHMY